MRRAERRGRCVVLVAGALLVLPCSGASGGREGATLAEVMASIEAGDYAAAEAALQSLADAPHAPAVEYLLGVVWCETGRAIEALAPLGRALAARPDRARWWHTLGRCQAEAGRYREALRSFDAAIALTEQALEDQTQGDQPLQDQNAWRFDKAMAAVRLADLALAERELRAVLARGGAGVDATAARFSLASVLHDLGRFEEARSLLERVLADSDTKAEAWFRLAQVELGAGHILRAREALERVLALEPAHPGALYHLGRLLRVSDPARAGPLLERYREAQARAEEIENRRAFVALHPRDPAARRELAQLLVTAGRWAEARAELERLLRVAPAEVAARELLAEVERRLGTRP